MVGKEGLRGLLVSFAHALHNTTGDLGRLARHEEAVEYGKGFVLHLFLADSLFNTHHLISGSLDNMKRQLSTTRNFVESIFFVSTWRILVRKPKCDLSASLYTCPIPRVM